MVGKSASNNGDEKMNVDTYRAVMDFSTRIGFPLAAALTVMFTSLVLANGILGSIIAAFVTFMFSFFVVKTFFSH